VKAHLLSFVTLAVLMASTGHAGQGAPATAGELYAAAVAREQAVRTAAGGHAVPLKDYRATLAAYDAVVRRFPTSSYVDNALWEGARIAREAFEWYIQEQDRSAARRMLALLVSDYPSSPLVPKAREALYRLDAHPAPSERPAPPTSTHPVSPKPPGGEPAKVSPPKPARRAPLLQAHRLPSPWGVLPGYEPFKSEWPRSQNVEPYSPPAESRSIDAVAPGSVPLPAPKAPPLPAAPRGPVSLARQLGLGASRIVIDPGHGGHDPGALGAGISEADIVLDIALRLESLLNTAGVEAVLTRRTDEFVPLDRRPAVATREQADLFLSIHVNASRVRSARGIESYVLNFATDPDAEAVAARENASTTHTMSNLPEIVRAITLNNKLDESRRFAALIQRTLAAQLNTSNTGLRDHGVKQAPFVVLIGAEMPSVLVEVGFITSPQEGRLLMSAGYRQRIAQALFDAVRGYQRSLKSAAAFPLR
jgi:N-acetylmuramoyl-L-alanine amidase